MQGEQEEEKSVEVGEEDDTGKKAQYGKERRRNLQFEGAQWKL